jgi:hypothetical protein
VNVVGAGERALGHIGSGKISPKGLDIFAAQLAVRAPTVEAFDVSRRVGPGARSLDGIDDLDLDLDLFGLDVLVVELCEIGGQVHCPGRRLALRGQMQIALEPSHGVGGPNSIVGADPARESGDFLSLSDKPKPRDLSNPGGVRARKLTSRGMEGFPISLSLPSPHIEVGNAVGPDPVCPSRESTHWTHGIVGQKI